MISEAMKREDRYRVIGIALGAAWPVVSEMLGARGISMEVPLDAFGRSG